MSKSLRHIPLATLVCCGLLLAATPAMGACCAVCPDGDICLEVSAGCLLEVTNNFGTTGPADGSLCGDMNWDGAVSGADLLAVTNNFGSTLGRARISSPSRAGTAVPEPGAAVPLAGAIFAIWCSKRLLGARATAN